MLNSTKNLVFIIGGAYGFSSDVYNRANDKLSLSKMTFTHQMVRLIFKSNYIEHLLFSMGKVPSSMKTKK